MRERDGVAAFAALRAVGHEYDYIDLQQAFGDLIVLVMNDNFEEYFPDDFAEDLSDNLVDFLGNFADFLQKLEDFQFDSLTDFLDMVLDNLDLVLLVPHYSQPLLFDFQLSQ